MEKAEACSTPESGAMEKALALREILEEVVSHMPLEVLKECRGVNQLWNQEVNRVIRPKAPVIRLRGVEALARCLETMSSSWYIPWTMFAVTGDVWTPEGALVLRQFFEDVALFATHLEIENSFALQMPSKKPQEVMEYSSLKSLELRFPGEAPSVTEPNMGLMIDILQNAPKLDSFSLESYVGNGQINFLDPIVQRVPWNNIQHLQLHQSSREHLHVFQRIVELGTEMQLKSLHMKVMSGMPTILPELGEILQRFLGRHSGTLETLKLQFRLLCQFSGYNLPRLPKLKTLEIHVELERFSGLLALPSFSQHFPILESVRITGRIKSERLFEFLRSEDNAPVGTVKILELQLYDLGETAVQGMLGELTRMFPGARLVLQRYP